MESVFTAVSQILKELWGRRFWIATVLPVLIFVTASLALFFEITQGLASAFTSWESSPLSSQALGVLSVLVVVTLLAYFIYGFQFVITQLFEGYWLRIPILVKLRDARVGLHKKRWEYLNALAESANTFQEANEIISEQLLYYPPPNHLNKMMPTQIGNVLRAAEIHPYDRYGIDAPVIWPRFYPLLETKIVEMLEEKKTAVDFMLLMSILAATFALAWCPILAVFTNRYDLFILCALGWPIAWICYKSAVQSARVYGEQVKATFDLYRYDLLKALNRPIPTDADAERKEWLRLTRFFYRNLPIPPYPSAPSKPKEWGRVADALADYLEKINQSKPTREEEE